MIRFIYLHCENTDLMKILLFSIILIGLAVLLLGVKVFFKKGGKFPSSHAGHSPALRKKGIGCSMDDEWKR